MSHKQIRTHKTHHGLNLGEAITFPLIVFFVPDHEANTQMSFCFETPKLKVLKFPKLGFLQIWRPITTSTSLRLRLGLKQSYSPCRKVSNGMWHATYTQINLGDSRLLVVGSQISSLTLDPSFGHNLCFKYPNGSSKLILNIYVLSAF
jgi:hypothetical protein